MREPTTLYVAVNGDDRWSGAMPEANADRSDGPFTTLQRARDALRERRKRGALHGPVTVAVRGGVYRPAEPLVLSPVDSGTPDGPVTWRAYRNELPVISGGRPLPSWRAAGNGLWTADASGARAADGGCRQLFINGRRAPRTRRPRDGFFLIDGMLPDCGKPLRFACRAGDLNPAWADGRTEVVILQNWYEMRHTLTAVDAGTRQAALAGVSSANGQLNPRFCAENVAEGLDEAGAWFFDWETGRVLYRSLPGEDAGGDGAVAPVLDCLLRLEGDGAGESVRHITFSGLAFHHTAWTLPEEGYNDRQAAHDIPAAIRADWARDCRFERCRFAHLGGYAVEWTTGCRDNAMTACELTDLGAGGVKIGEPAVYEDQNHPRISRDNTVEDCEIRDIGHVYPAAVGVWIGHSAGNKVVRNHIHDTYYTGISAGWTWGYGSSNTRDNLLAHNRIHHIGRGLLSDMGGIYLLGRQPGTVVRNNTIHDIESYVRGYGGWGIYLDEGCTQVLVEKNLVYRTASGGFHQHYGRENVIRNNIFALSREGQILRTRQEDHLSFTLERNIVYCDRAFPLSGNWSNGRYRLDRNLYFRRDGLAGTHFHAPLVYLGLRPFPRGFLGERASYDTVAMDERVATTSGMPAGSRFLGAVPSCGAPAEGTPAAEDWERALLLPGLVNAGGDAVPLGDTETRLLRTDCDLHISVLCRHSRIADPDPGMSSDPKQENVEVFLKPSVSEDACEQLYLKADGTALTYGHPADAWTPIAWDGRAERTETGWRAVFRVPIAALRPEGGPPGPWQIFVGRYALLPPMTFRDWQAAGQDRHSLVADPLFRAPEEDDFRLRPDSPALGLGFQALDEMD